MLKTTKEKILFTLIVLVGVCIVCVLLFSFGKNDTADMVPEPTKYVPDPQPTSKIVVKEVEKLVEVEKEITSDIIEDGLRDMGTLITEEYYFTEVMGYSSVKKFLKTDIVLNFTETSYLASYDGVVSAGMDFNALKVEKNEDGIVIRLPAAQIISVTVDPNSFELYSEKVGLWNPLSIEDFNTSLTELEETAKTKASERGVLARANENARSVIYNFVSSLVDTSVCPVTLVTD